MGKEETAYLAAGRACKGSEESQMFGKPCFKINGKAFVSLFDNCMVFKLTGDMHKEALSLDGSQLFDPSGKGRAMKEWVQVPYHYQAKWAAFAKAAFSYVKNNS
jgi:hypothetical protein